MDEIKKKFFEDLLNKRIIYLDGKINAEMAVNIGKAIIWLNALNEADSITLYIDSGGGDAASGLDIYDIIRHSRAPVIGIVYRRANSMAVVILQACKIRKSLKYAKIVLHNLLISDKSLDELIEDPKKALEESIGKQESIYSILNQRSGLGLEEIKKMCKEEKGMYSDEAKKLGLIDEVI